MKVSLAQNEMTASVSQSQTANKKSDIVKAESITFHFSADDVLCSEDLQTLREEEEDNSILIKFQGVAFDVNVSRTTPV